MGATFHNGNGGDQSQLGITLQVGDVNNTDIAHGGLDLVQRSLHIVVQGACVGDVGIDTFLERKLCRAAQVVTLPVTGTVGAFAPVLLHVSAVDQNLCGGAFVEAGEVTAQHQEVRTHGQSQGHVVVMNDTTVRADGHINAGFCKVLITGCCDFDQSGCLTAADALGLTGDADGAAANTDLDKVRAGLCQKTETFTVNHVAWPIFTVSP